MLLKVLKLFLKLTMLLKVLKLFLKLTISNFHICILISVLYIIISIFKINSHIHVRKQCGDVCEWRVAVNLPLHHITVPWLA
jgi:hypothetical protein